MMLRTIGIFCIVCSAARGDEPPAEIADAVTDADSSLRHSIKSPYQAGTTTIRVLLPGNLEAGRRYPVLFVLPVEAGDEHRFGSGLAEIKRHDLHNKHQFISVHPTFSHLPWYGDHSTNPAIRQESYFVKVVLPFVRERYPVKDGSDNCLLLGFSKSGWGAYSLLLRHPDLFGRAAAWDAPLEKTAPNQFGMNIVFDTQQNFERYQITKALENNAALFQDKPRFGLFGYDNFRDHHVAAHKRMADLRIAHEYRDGPQRAHTWGSGWVPEAVEFLLPTEKP